jgi:hypothetical protein
MSLWLSIEYVSLKMIPHNVNETLIMPNHARIFFSKGFYFLSATNMKGKSLAVKNINQELQGYQVNQTN